MATLLSTPSAWMKYAKTLDELDLDATIAGFQKQTDDYLDVVVRVMRANESVLSDANRAAGEILRNPIHPFVAELCEILGCPKPTVSNRAMNAAGDCRWFDFSNAIERAKKLRRAALDELNRRCGL